MMLMAWMILICVAAFIVFGFLAVAGMDSWPDWLAGGFYVLAHTAVLVGGCTLVALIFGILGVRVTVR